MQLAQLNIATAKYQMDAPEIQYFVESLDRINLLAEQSPGFIWRLKDETGNATEIKAFDDPNIIVNMSIWQSEQALKDFMFKTAHKEFLARKKEWFHRAEQETYVLWWVEEGHIPTLDEAKERLDYLRRFGDSAYAFTFRNSFTELDVREREACEED
ncbi:DUF3291 domain-containing protein [Pseudoalteromonas sp. S2755]|uniref:DUF3291 domain-containing protein n=1 Tax=Pseudoalteromonas sp. S2755 TaxID=2066523 RepID=UPI00110B9AC4|nr:DUF3291 domain-containing protein [Pseudoalteromonas sp. S2755]TMN39964.1 DUF3291 domain-containing protein [Pseudoalteromonas sp. S2755]